jgi:hypothetical protein
MNIEVNNDKVTINNFETDVSEVVAYFETLKKELEEKKLSPEELQKQLIIELEGLLRLGALAAKAGNVGLSTDYVDEQVAKMKEKMVVSLQEEFADFETIVKEYLDPNVDGATSSGGISRLLAEVEKIKNKLNIHEVEEKTSGKGFKFEDYCLPILESIANVFGDTVDPTGDTEGMIDKKGDFVYTIKDLKSKIVLEMKDKEQITLPYIKEQLDGGMANRGAQYGIFISKKREALPNYVGSFNDYDDNKLVIALGSELEDEIIHKDLIRVAISWARSKLKQESGQGSGIDTGKIRIKIESVQKKMGDLRNVKTKCTSIENDTKEITKIVGEVEKAVEKDLKEILESMNA